MFWEDRTTRVAGAVLLVFVVLVIASIALDWNTTNANPLARNDTEELLRDIEDGGTLFALINAVNIATDAVATLAMAAVVYLLFRDRSQMLALFAAFGLMAGAIGFTTGYAANVTLAYLAADYVEEGGAGTIAAGDPVILQTARAIAALSMISVFVAFTSIGFGIVSIGAVIAVAPEGAVNPPRWSGALAIVTGVLAAASWVTLANYDAGMTVLFFGMVGMLVFLVVLGGWLLIHNEPGQARQATGMPLST